MKVKIFTEHDEPRYSNGNCIVSLEKELIILSKIKE